MRPARLIGIDQDHNFSFDAGFGRLNDSSGALANNMGFATIDSGTFHADTLFGFAAPGRGGGAGGGVTGFAALNEDQRGGVGPNNKPSLTNAEAGAQIGRNNITWNGSGVLGQAASVTYAFRSTAPTTMPDDTAGFSRFNATQIIQAERALQSWSDVARITFSRVSNADGYSNSAQILFGNYATGAAGAAAFAYFPGTGIGGDVWINSSLSYNVSPANLNYGRQTVTHEIGHALGLNHPGDYNAGNGTPTYANSAVYYEDTRQYTIMSYWSEANTGGNNGGYYAAAPLLDDIAAIQRLYGANTATRTGNDVYGFNSTTGRDFYSATSASTPVIFAVWDAGGNDTFDFSGYSQNQRIDLNDGNFSNVGGLIGNVAIALGVTIENAIGGSGADTIIGNEAANTIRGGAGNDVIDGNAGADSLYGGTGADTFLFDQLSDSSPTAIDRIFDFTSGSDRIDLSRIDARTNVAGDQAFTLVTSFTGVSGQLTRSYSATNNTTTIRADVNGDGVADFVLYVNGQIASTDLIL